MRWQVATAIAFAAGLGGCVDSSDPAAGGFYNGIAGVAGGGYQARVDEREGAVAEAQARNAALTAEQQSLAAQLASTERAVTQARFDLLKQRNATPGMDAATANRVNRVLAAQPKGATDAARLADLQRILSETRALSADLARLSG